MASRKSAAKVGATVGAVVAAIPAIPVAWTMAWMSFGDYSGASAHPQAQGVTTAIVVGLIIIAVGAFCGFIIGSIVARFT